MYVTYQSLPITFCNLASYFLVKFECEMPMVVKVTVTLTVQVMIFIPQSGFQGEAQKVMLVLGTATVWQLCPNTCFMCILDGKLTTISSMPIEGCVNVETVKVDS